jgi:hypothetical protein
MTRQILVRVGALIHPQRGTMTHPRAFSVMLTCLIGTTSSLQAEMTYVHPNAVTTITAGWFCRVAPDAAGQGQGGPVNLYREPFPFVETGDTFPSQAGIGIGVVAQLSPFLKDSLVEARDRHGADERRWKMRVHPDGLVWLGHLHDSSSDFPPGLWEFSLWRGQEEVFRYEITVLPRAPGDSSMCGTPIS